VVATHGHCFDGLASAVLFSRLVERLGRSQGDDSSLEASYRDTLGRAPIATYVDREGDIVWLQEYLRYRVNGCGHGVAVQSVFLQIDGAPPPALCH